MNARKTWTAWMGGIAIFAGLGCATTTQVHTDHDPTARFSQYRTFALSHGQVINDGLVDTRDTLVRDRINAALQEELANKGLQPTNLNPDLIVTYTAGVRTRQDLTSYWGYTYYDYSPMPYVWTTERPQGTLVIDFIDPKSAKLVWRSVARSDNRDLRKPENIEKAVDKALEKFPLQQG